jgi:hypothetical protein
MDACEECGGLSPVTKIGSSRARSRLILPVRTLPIAFKDVLIVSLF